MLTALLTLAIAAGPAPAKQAPNPGSPKQEEAAAPKACPPATPCPPCSDADTALARALAWVAEPAPEEIRAIAVEDLGLLGDPRALNTLALLILDPSPAVQMASLRAVRSFTTPRAEEILANVIRHPYPSEAVKTFAVESMAFQRTPSARQFLEHVSTGSQFTSKLQAVAKQALQRGWSSAPP